MSKIKQKKTLAKKSDLAAGSFRDINDRINEFATKVGLKKYEESSRIWECPWLYRQISRFDPIKTKLLDVGTELSPLPWYLASEKYTVTVGDIRNNFWNDWLKAYEHIDGKVDMRNLNAENINISTASQDIYLSVSVIEHVGDKKTAFYEAARVLKPGGYIIMTFDICQPKMGMKFPKWNGEAMKMGEFDEIIESSPWFESKVSNIKWNKEDIREYLEWHRSTEEWHNYVTGAAVVRRNEKEWAKEFTKDTYRETMSALKYYYQISKTLAKRETKKYFKI